MELTDLKTNYLKKPNVYIEYICKSLTQIILVDESIPNSDRY